MKQLQPAVLVIMLATTVAQGAEVQLICEDKSETAALFRKRAPTLGIDVYAFDSVARTVKQLDGELKDMKLLSVGVTEAEIRFEQSGYINQPQITETFQTTISRVSGKWVRHPHYVDEQGRWVAGSALEHLARPLGLWGAFGIRQRPDEGECTVDNRKF